MKQVPYLVLLDLRKHLHVLNSILKTVPFDFPDIFPEEVFILLLDVSYLRSGAQFLSRISKPAGRKVWEILPLPRYGCRER